MTDSDWTLLAHWLNHGPGALMSADELRVLFSSREAVYRLARELRGNRFARPCYVPGD